MTILADAVQRLRAIDGFHVTLNEPLREHTRFGLGGAAALWAEASTKEALGAGLAMLRELPMTVTVIGGGSNLIVADEGVTGAVVRFTGSGMWFDAGLIYVESGAVLQALVDFSIGQSLDGLHTMTGIPGWVGGAVYGNAGAYGHSISEFVEEVAYVDVREPSRVLTRSGAACEFAYRESIFKRNKEWVIVSATLRLPSGEGETLQRRADEILTTRNAKYPPTMKCAGSIFKNFWWRDLPVEVQARVPKDKVIEGKVPSAWFLEQVNAKGMRRGDIQVATYHANLIYNDGPGASASDLRVLIAELQRRVREEFGIAMEAEVQMLG